MQRPDPFRLGVNYWPADTAMGWLADYDGGVLRRDFARIADAGMDTVRVFLRWDDVQPDPARVSVAALASIVDSADAAEAAGVELIVTLFTGHMSGVNWIPSWAVGGAEGDARFRVVSGATVHRDRRILRNWYADREVRDGQAHLAHRVVSALAGHPAVWAWDLGNENSNCTIPPHRGQADQWMDRMSSVLRACDPRVLITIGTHMEDLEEERLLGPAEVARWCDFVCMHGYPSYATWSGGPTDVHFVPFLAELTQWLAGPAPVLFAEFGHPTVPAGGSPAPAGLAVAERQASTYAGTVLDELRAAGTLGALAWCFSDYAPSLFDKPPFDEAMHERTFGLWRADGTAKPAVAEYTRRAGLPRLEEPRERSWIDVTPAEFASSRRGQLSRLYGRYLDERRAGCASATVSGRRTGAYAPAAEPSHGGEENMELTLALAVDRVDEDLR